MVIKITRLILLLQLLAAGAIAAALHGTRGFSAASAIVCGLAAVVLLRMLISANNFYMSWRFGSETPPAWRLNWRQRCRLYLQEFKATMVSSSITMPFLSFSRRMAAEPNGLPVLLVHGYGCNSGYWHAMSKTLSRARISHHAIDLEPVFCSIDLYVPAIHAAVEKLCAESGSPRIVILAHSMGGLAARAYLRDHGTARIARVITLGTPHRGTGIANFGHGANCEQMRWTPGNEEGTASPWLRELEESENREVRALLVSIYSHHDNIIAPQTSSHLSGATNIPFAGIGHVSLASHPAIQACVLRELQAIPDNRAEQSSARPASSAS